MSTSAQHSSVVVCKCNCEHAIMLASCTCALASLIPVALYQLGAIQALPDPPSPIFASERITSSKAAHPFGVPDSLLGLASFGTTFALIVLSRQSTAAKKLLGAKLALDVSAAAFNASRQVISFRRLCSWCTATALSAGIMAFAGRHTIRQTGACALNTVRSLQAPDAAQVHPISKDAA